MFLVLGQVWSQGLTVWHLRHLSFYLKWLSRLILHFSCALDTSYNVVMKDLVSSRSLCWHHHLTMTNVTLTDKIPRPRSEPLLGCLRVLPEFLTIHQKDDRRNPSQRQSCGRLDENTMPARFKQNKNSNKHKGVILKIPMSFGLILSYLLF